MEERSSWLNNEEVGAGTSSGLSVAEMVAQVATQVVHEQSAPPGFFYVEQYGAYYGHESGYYYYPDSDLYYHPTNQCFWKFDPSSRQYELYNPAAAGVEPENLASSWTRKRNQKRAQRIFGEQFVQKAPQEDVEILELTLDLVDRCSFLAGDLSGGQLKKRAALEEQRAGEEELHGGITVNFNASRHPNSVVEEESESEGELDTNTAMERELARRQTEEEYARNAPCIRLVEQPAGRLHIVTITGARIGFGAKMDIQLDNRAVAKPNEQCDDEIPLFCISYQKCELASSEKGCYVLEVDRRTDVPIFSCEYNLLPNEKWELHHEDRLIIGSDGARQQLIVHIHNGLNSCQGCEPGLFAKSTSNESPIPKKRCSRNAERVRQTRILKEQYGLLEDDDTMRELKRKYTDRASKRRREIGSDLCNDSASSGIRNAAGGIYAGCTAAPVPGTSVESVQLRSTPKPVANAKITTENKGFQILKGMGWKEGQGLGKCNQGIQGPVEATLKNDRAGLGTSTQKIAIRLNAGSKIAVLERTRQRYEQIERSKKEGATK